MDIYAYIFVAFFVAFVALTLKFTFEPEPEEHVGMFTREEATKLIELKGCFNEKGERIKEKRHTSGAEYDSTC